MKHYETGIIQEDILHLSAAADDKQKGLTTLHTYTRYSDLQQQVITLETKHNIRLISVIFSIRLESLVTI